jgi:hypothetical protein
MQFLEQIKKEIVVHTNVGACRLFRALAVPTSPGVNEGICVFHSVRFGVFRAVTMKNAVF